VTHHNPTPTVDIIIELIDRPNRPIVLIERRNEPLGWAIPGGFIDYGESAESAAMREAFEETCLQVELVKLLGVYSDPKRDPRQHTMSAVYVATAIGDPIAEDDAQGIGVFELWEIPQLLCFDHDRILRDYRYLRDYGLYPKVK
jgi:8-oxo-dGTP diphosphatase